MIIRRGKCLKNPRGEREHLGFTKRGLPWGEGTRGIEKILNVVAKYPPLVGGAGRENREIALGVDLLYSVKMGHPGYLEI